MHVTDIIMSAPMIRATLREIERPGTGKTQTRRLAWRSNKRTDANYVAKARLTKWQNLKAGDRLWVRESWAPIAGCTGIDPGIEALAAGCFYRANPGTTDSDVAKWIPSIHMPRARSRLTLDVTAVKLQQLQEISEEDACAEGMQEPSLRVLGGALAQAAWSAIQVFARLWQHLHGAGSWDANPEIVAITFKPYLCNVDQMERAT